MNEQIEYEYSIAIDGGNPEDSFDVTAAYAEAKRWADRWVEQGVDAHVVYREVRVDRGPWERHP